MRRTYYVIHYTVGFMLAIILSMAQALLLLLSGVLALAADPDPLREAWRDTCRLPGLMWNRATVIGYGWRQLLEGRPNILACELDRQYTVGNHIEDLRYRRRRQPDYELWGHGSSAAFADEFAAKYEFASRVEDEE